MYCKNCGKEVNENQAICLNCGVKNGVGDKYCRHCGSEVNPQAEICLNCGMAIKNNVSIHQSSIKAGTREEAYAKLAHYEKISAIVWFVIAGLQIIIGIFSYYAPILIGLWNIYAGLSRLKYSKLLEGTPEGVYEYFKKQGTSNIVFLVLNIFLGGLIGGIAAGFDIYIRKYVMDNEEFFN